MDIAAERKSLGLSQAAIAARIGVNQATVSRWEKGDLTPNSRDLIAIRSAMDDFIREQTALAEIARETAA